ncbi:hypothetical protein, partial [Klebsiella quasipneumoniae]|uniref:hypothetical protein n=1 Tax=Klebsiella quasipneumoniae TaxID=1463165 RepID=UPI00272FEE0D
IPAGIVRDFKRMNLELVQSDDADLNAMIAELELHHEIRALQWEDEELVKIRREIPSGNREGFEVKPDGSLRFKERWCVPDVPVLKRRILDEA